MIEQTAVCASNLWTWHDHDFRAMNTDVHLRLVSPAPHDPIRRVVDTFRYFEGLLSRFLPDSELSRLNRSQDTLFVASPDFYSAVEAALWAVGQTDGIFEPAILPFLERAGYSTTFSAVAGQRPLRPGEPAAGPAEREPCNMALPHGTSFWQVVLDPFTQTIQRPPGLQLDLGGMGKGWTVDRVVDDLVPDAHFLLNAGGDLYAYGDGLDGHGWQIHLAHPYLPQQCYATLRLAHHALATSTVARRRWVQNGVVQHHLIDPRTGRPARTDAISVSVVASRSFVAEVYAKVALILGVSAGLAFLEAIPGVEAVILDNSTSVHPTSGMAPMLDRLNPAGYRAPSQHEVLIQ